MKVSMLKVMGKAHDIYPSVSTWYRCTLGEENMTYQAEMLSLGSRRYRLLIYRNDFKLLQMEFYENSVTEAKEYSLLKLAQFMQHDRDQLNDNLTKIMPDYHGYDKQDVTGL